MKMTPGTLFRTSILSLSSLFLFSSCDKDDENTNGIYQINATLNGASVVPANSSTGTGSVTGTYNSKDNVLTYNASWNGLTGTATSGHFHSTASGTPLRVFTIVGASASGVTPLTEEEEKDLLEGKWYVDLHTGTYPNGEVRGQVSATK